MSHTAGNVSHFTIHADDPQRAMQFYGQVFGWRFQPWGPPGFWMIQTGPANDPGIHGALHGRQEPRQGTGVCGFECTIAVADVDAIAKAVVAAGGTITSPRFDIPGVGAVVNFRDPDGHPVAAMQYVAAPPTGRR
jgi:predicted enzyme related to lactoylglutathione lyase